MAKSGDNLPSLLVVLDTNKWYGHKLLRSALGSALIYAVKDLEAKIGLLEVTKKEVISKCKEKGSESVKKIRNNLREIKNLTGEAPDPELPNEEKIQEQVSKRLEELEDLTITRKPTIDHYESSLEKTVFKRPPSEDGNGFRDCLIWEAILEWSLETKVAFITDDGDFFDSNKDALHPELEQELKEVEGNLDIYLNIKGFLSSLKQEITEPDPELIAEEISKSLESEIYDLAKEKGFDIDHLQDSELYYFLTQTPEYLAVDFNLQYIILNLPISEEEEEIPRANMQVSGSCKYSKEKEKVSDIQLEEIKLETLSGEKIYRRVIAKAKPIVVGTEMNTYSLKTSLDEHFNV